MKLVDEKGKLFGKINIVDLLVIILIAAVAVVLAVKFLGGSDTVGNGGDNPAMIYTVRVMEVDQATYENVCEFVDSAAGVKDQLMSNGSLLDGYVVDVTATGHTPSAADTVGGDTLDLVFTIEVIPSDSLTGTVGSQEVRIGKSHIVKTVHFEFEGGVVLTCEWAD